MIEFDSNYSVGEYKKTADNSKLINLYGEYKFKNIIYISCNYETQERDVKNLKGFTIKNIEIFDQFPNTKHLEIVSLFSRE